MRLCCRNAVVLYAALSLEAQCKMGAVQPVTKVYCSSLQMEQPEEEPEEAKLEDDKEVEVETDAESETTLQMKPPAKQEEEVEPRNLEEDLVRCGPCKKPVEEWKVKLAEAGAEVLVQEAKLQHAKERFVLVQKACKMQHPCVKLPDLEELDVEFMRDTMVEMLKAKMEEQVPTKKEPLESSCKESSCSEQPPVKLRKLDTSMQRQMPLHGG